VCDEGLGILARRVRLSAVNPEGVLFSTPDGRISAANPAACALLDRSGKEISRLGCDGLVDQEDPRWTIAVAERDRTGSSVAVARLRRGDGRDIDIETTSRLFHDENGSVLARIGGTKFVVLALGLAEPECADATGRIRRHLAAAEATEFVGSHVEASFGWATREAGDRTSLEDLAARSDWAMLEARDARRAARGPDQA
jgi:hypothetical protein